jgi:hypothetical protein
MRRRLLAFLLVPFILVAFISCEGDIFGTISDFMGQTSSNVYAENGLVQIDTSQGAAVTESTGSILALAEPVTDSSASGYDADAVAVYEAAYEEKVETIKDSITEALTSPTKTEALVEALSEPLAPTTAPPTKVKDAVAKISEDSGVTIHIPDPNAGTASDFTEGDMVTLILLTELYEEAESIDFDTASEDDLLQFVSDAKQVVDTVKKVSPAGSINLDEILESLIDDPDVYDQLFRSSSTSRSTPRVEEESEDDAMTFVKPIFENVINSIGTEVVGADEVIISKNLTRAISGFGMMRLSYERMAPGLVRSGVELDLPDVINYALSVIFTEADDFFDSVATGTTFEVALNDVIVWMESEDKEKTEPDFMSDETFDWGTAFDSFIEVKPAFGSDGTIRKTLDSLIGAIPSDLTLLEDALDDLFEPEPEV